MADVTTPGPAPARASRARPAHDAPSRPRFGDVDPASDEGRRIAGGVGRLLVAERARRGWSTAELAREAGLSPRTVDGLIKGNRRPSEATCWRLAAALWGDRSERSVAALAARLQDAAGESLRSTRRPHRRRARLIAEARGGTTDGAPVADSDTLASVSAALFLPWGSR